MLIQLCVIIQSVLSFEDPEPNGPTASHPLSYMPLEALKSPRMISMLYGGMDFVTADSWL